MRHVPNERYPGVGPLVRAYRREAGLTQRELAAKAGLSLAALRDIEQSRRRRPRFNSLAALADACGLDSSQADDLMSVARDPQHVQASRQGYPVAEKRGGRPEGLWVSALGPLEVRWNGEHVPLGPPTRRAILGLLLMDPWVLVRRDKIIHVLWGEAPPRTATDLVQAHVSRLRNVLPSAGGLGDRSGVIESIGGAYRLRLSGDELDVLVFRDLSNQAAAARSRGDNLAACELYEQAVGFWKGDPLADLDLLCDHPGITILRQQLIGCLLGYADVTCALGQYSDALARLQAVASVESLNEPVHARLMIALAGLGQQAAAISVYEGLRTRLNRELGLYPGEELAEAHRKVLTQAIHAPRVSAGQSLRRGFMR